MNKMKKVMFCIILLFIVVTIAKGTVFKKPPIDNTFNKEKWDSFSEEYEKDRYIRRRMMDDLLETYQLVGMTREEIRELLGFDTSFEWRPDCIAYAIGETYIDRIFLVISFDEDDVVKSHGILID